MRLRRGESLTDEEYSTDLSIVNYLTDKGAFSTHGADAARCTERPPQARDCEGQACQRHGRRGSDSHGGDRTWNTIQLWSEVHILAPGVDMRRDDAFTEEDQQEGDTLLSGPEAHPPEGNESNQMQSTTRIVLEAPSQLKKAIPFMHEWMRRRSSDYVARGRTWQEALFGNVHAFREGTQTEEHTEAGEKAGNEHVEHQEAAENIVHGGERCAETDEHE
ncbi:unnamed protein product [Symbiodinium sp. CCMP2592]|nr:unnamed protein product [Symbiodinium sp. CCMP2592]